MGAAAPIRPVLHPASSHGKTGSLVEPEHIEQWVAAFVLFSV